MAPTNQGSRVLELTALFFLVVTTILPAAVTSGGGGFSLELIHRDSPRSPLYHGNLTDLQRVQRQLQSSKFRALWLEQSIHVANNMNLTAIRPVVHERLGTYMVAVSIGTGQGLKSFYLKLDTGSSLSWIQCHPCSPKFRQSDPMFEPNQSATFSHVPCNDTFCVDPFHCNEHKCGYTIHYTDETSITGYLSRDSFTFQSVNGRHEVVRSMAFGCTHSSHMNFIDRPSGVMGLDGSRVSFAMQLTGHTDGRFSYCLFNPKDATKGFLRFGNDIITFRGAKTTPLLRFPPYTSYYLVLKDVSIDNRRLNITEGTFDRHADGFGGVVIDSGLEFSCMVEHAYDRVKDVLVEYFRITGLSEFRGRQSGLHLDLCYNKPNDFQSFLPNMTLHFQLADLHIRPQALFWLGEVGTRSVFCLGIEPHNRFTVLGAMQQYYNRFIYDIKNQELSFAPENCATEGRNQ